jgi:hypothetical protein
MFERILVLSAEKGWIAWFLLLKNQGGTWEVPIIHYPPATIHHQGIGISSELGAVPTELIQYLQFEHFPAISIGDLRFCQNWEHRSTSKSHGMLIPLPFFAMRPLVVVLAMREAA